MAITATTSSTTVPAPFFSSATAAISLAHSTVVDRPDSRLSRLSSLGGGGFDRLAGVDDASRAASRITKPAKSSPS